MCKVFKLRKEKMEKVNNVLLQLSSNGYRLTSGIERHKAWQRLQSESEQLQLFSTLVIFWFVRLNSCTSHPLGLPACKTKSRVRSQIIRHIQYLETYCI